MRLALTLLAGAMAVTACGGSDLRERSLKLTECRLPRLAQAAQCGTLEVPEDRSRPDGRRIGIFVGVLPANTLSPKADPLFILAGGPGQAASRLAPFAAQLAAIRRTRDIVLVDQRGTGRSAALDCAALKPARYDVFDIDPLPKATACKSELRARGVDPAQYTTSAFVADLDAVRAALGYPRVNLWGGSYGSRAALEYLRRYPDRVRSLVLDGVAPPSLRITLDVWPTRDAAIDAILDACGRNPACAAAHPDATSELAAIERELAGEERKVAIADPQTGEKIEMPVTFDLIIAALHPLTYAPELSALLPELLDRVRQGDYAPLLAASLAITGDLSEQVTPALHYSVTCAEDVSRITPDEREKMLARVRGKAIAERLIGICDTWPRGAMPADFGDPVKSDVPVLLLSGGLDPVTPPSNAETLKQSLPNSRHIVAPGYGHLVSPHACAPRLIAAFVDSASINALPSSCVEFLEKTSPPPFYPNRLAPQT